MVFLHQFLLAALDCCRCRIAGKAHRIERLRLQALQLAPLGLEPRPATASLPDKPERILDPVLCARRTGAKRRMQWRMLCGLVDADRPCRTMAGDGLLLVARNLAIGKPGKVVVALVVFLHMLEAEQEELAFGIAPDRRTMGARPLAPVPLACGGLDLSLLRSLSARPNAIEIFGIQDRKSTRLNSSH